jgi:hypothetical protein
MIGSDAQPAAHERDADGYPRKVGVVECWEYDLGLMGDVCDVLRRLADDLEAADGALLSVIVSADNAREVQAIVDLGAA